jgi:rod shape determining protein RodA
VAGIAWPLRRAPQVRSGWQGLVSGLHLDWPLLAALLALFTLSLIVLYSASDQDLGLVMRQAARIGLALLATLVAAMLPPQQLRSWAPWLYGAGVTLLLAVVVVGDIGKGAQRWLDLGLIRFQPSEIMKLAVPLMLARYLGDRPLPPSLWHIAIAVVLLAIPAALITEQPDLGTALLVGCSGAAVLFLAGMSWRLIGLLAGLVGALAPVAWFFMHDYQRQRVLMFLDPEGDPLGAGYHIIQSKIAVGSGGLYGKGWLNGTQSHLDFLPERSTDFIFAVLGEEWGLMGGLVLLGLYFLVVVRGLYIVTQAQDNFSRLLAGSLTLTFLVYVFVNVGMVTGLLPVVGLPLPLISYGGTSMVTLLAAFGMLMSIHTHRKLIPH